MSDVRPTGGQPGMDVPTTRPCAECGAELAEPYGWCGNCRAAYCFPCGRGHFCTAGCVTSGCHAGLCVCVFERGRLSDSWGLPDD